MLCNAASTETRRRPRISLRAAICSAIFSIPFTIGGCAKEHSAIAPAADSPTGLVREIAQVEGRFYKPAGAVEYVYSNEIALAEILGKRDGKRALIELVECLDDDSPSRSTIDGIPAPVGLVCYAAIPGVAYHEETDATGDIVQWDGYFPLDDHPAPGTRARAKKAWKRAISQGSYILH